MEFFPNGSFQFFEYFFLGIISFLSGMGGGGGGVGVGAWVLMGGGGFKKNHGMGGTPRQGKPWIRKWYINQENQFSHNSCDGNINYTPWLRSYFSLFGLSVSQKHHFSSFLSEVA